MNSLLQTTHELNLPIYSYILMAVLALVTALFFSKIYAFVYSESFMQEGSLQRAFPFLSISITTIFCVLQFSIPLSLGLLGSLSIVRFRSPIKEPLDVCFILVLIANSLLIATANFAFMAVVILLIVLAVIIIKYQGLRSKSDNVSQWINVSIKVSNADHPNVENLMKTKFNSLFSKILIKNTSKDSQSSYFSFQGLTDSNFSTEKVVALLTQDASISFFYEV